MGNVNAVPYSDFESHLMLRARHYGFPEYIQVKPLPSVRELTELFDYASYIASHEVRPHRPPVVWCEPLPDSPSWSDDRNYPPMDYMGAYFSGDDVHTGMTVPARSGRRIELYPDRIKECSTRLYREHNPDRLHKEEVYMFLERIVLIHEYYHALLHLGCTPRESPLSDRPTPNDVADMLLSRGRIWRNLSPRVLEQHAQLATWYCIRDSPPDRELFLRLMKQQPSDYVLDQTMLDSPPMRLWVWMSMRVHQNEFLSESEMRMYIEATLPNADIVASADIVLSH